MSTTDGLSLDCGHWSLVSGTTGMDDGQMGDGRWMGWSLEDPTSRGEQPT